ncbi:MAG: signal peptidase II [Chloroflexi bacterium]|nr:signal peptidase II [Chloroflexota bacterium]
MPPSLFEEGNAAAGQAPASAARQASGGRFVALYLGIAALILVVDQLTKLWVRANLLPRESLPDTGFFRLTNVQNTGSAFGLFANQTLLLTIISVVAVGMLLVLMRYQPLRNVWGGIAMSLLLGGASGNLIDRVRLGYVTDFIDIGLGQGYRFFTFNVADSAITVGALLLALTLYHLGKPAAAQRPA